MDILQLSALATFAAACVAGFIQWRVFFIGMALWSVPSATGLFLLKDADALWIFAFIFWCGAHWLAVIVGLTVGWIAYLVRRHSVWLGKKPGKD